MSASLVGSEMCIRDRELGVRCVVHGGDFTFTGCDSDFDVVEALMNETVSYTHLTLPTICSV
eukprot:15120891-Alexandrium_andersonii.AAC.1